MERSCFEALWNESFNKPLSWSRGFKTSFKSLVESLFQWPYETTGKLLGRANLDWLGNPESRDVRHEHMREGAPATLQMIEDCSPELVLPMDKSTFDVLFDVLKNNGFEVTPCECKAFTVLISAAKRRFHRYLFACRVKAENGREFVMIKLPQHPARMFNADYGRRCGEAVREAALQIAIGQPVDVTNTK